MNILFIYPRMFHPHRGGIERVSELLCLEFQARGHSVFFLHNIEDPSLLKYPYPAPLYFFPFSVQEIEKNCLFYQHFLSEHAIDIVINQDPLTYHSLCRLSRNQTSAKTISVIHNSPLNIYDYLLPLTMRLRNDTFIEKFKRVARILKVPQIKSDYWRRLKACYEDSFSYTDCVCLLSSKFIPELRRIYSQNLDKVISIGNPNTYPSQSSSEYSKKKQILYVGRLEWYQKRVDRLVTIWKRIYKEYPEWELVLVGGGPIRCELEQRFSSMERVVFAGYQNPETFYRDASILCLTSDFEGWGMVLTEAMIFGTIPVVFNSFAAVTDIIEDGKTGILVDPFSCKQFAGKLSLLMQNEGMRSQMAKACVQSVKRFDTHNVVDKWEDTFRKLERPI